MRKIRVISAWNEIHLSRYSDSDGMWMTESIANCHALAHTFHFIIYSKIALSHRNRLFCVGVRMRHVTLRQLRSVSTAIYLWKSRLPIGKLKRNIPMHYVTMLRIRWWWWLIANGCHGTSNHSHNKQKVSTNQNRLFLPVCVYKQQQKNVPELRTKTERNSTHSKTEQWRKLLIFYLYISVDDSRQFCRKQQNRSLNLWILQ